MRRGSGPMGRTHGDGSAVMTPLVGTSEALPAESDAPEPDAGGDRVSLHARIAADVEAAILSGSWPPGHRLPIETELAAQYGCSRMTVNKAMVQLAAAGLIERRRKSGTHVRLPQAQSAVLEISDIREEVLALGVAYRYAVLKARRRRRSAQDLRLLGAPGAGPVLALDCLHFAGPRPFCREQRLIDLVTVPSAAQEAFGDQPPGRWLLERVPWSIAEHTIRATVAEEEMASTLHIAAGAACLVVERRTRLEEKPVTFVRLTYPGAVHALTASFRPGR